MSHAIARHRWALSYTILVLLPLLALALWKCT